MIQVFKIIKDIDDIPIDDFFQISESTTRGHSHKIFKPRSQKSIRQNSFSVRTVEDWNSLPEEVVSVKTVLQFKIRLDKMWMHRSFDFYVFVRVCLYMLCGHLLGKGCPFGSRLWCLL